MRRQPSARVSSVRDGVTNPRPARAGGRGILFAKGLERWNDITGFVARAKKSNWQGARRQPKRDLPTRNWQIAVGQRPKRRRRMPLQHWASPRFEPTNIWSMAIDTLRPVTTSLKLSGA